MSINIFVLCGMNCAREMLYSVNSVALSADGKTAVSGSLDKTVMV